MSSRLGVYWRSCIEEHRTEEAQRYLEDAMEDMDLEVLQTTIRVAQEKHVDQEVIDAALERVEVVTQMVAAEEELLSAIDGFDLARLQAALEAGEELELDAFLSEETLEAAIERFTFLQHRTESENELRLTIAGSDIEDLQTKLTNARRFHVGFEALQLGDDRVAELHQLMAEAASELTAALATRDAARVTNAMQTAETFRAVDSIMLQQAQDRLQHLVRMEAASQELLEAIEGVALHDLREKLEFARNLDADPDTLRQGDDRVATLMQMNLVAEQNLITATAGTDSTVLQAAIHVAERLDAVSNNVIEAGKARLFDLARRGELRAELLFAIEGEDLQLVEEKLARATDLGVAADVLTLGSQRVAELEAIRDARTVLEAAINGHDENVLSEALAEAERLAAASSSLASRARARLHELAQREEVKNELLRAMEGVNLDVLEDIWATAQNLGVDQPTLILCEHRREELNQIMSVAEEDLQAAIHTRESELVRAALDEALRVHAADAVLQTRAEERLAHLALADAAMDELIPALGGVDLALVQIKLDRAREFDVEPDVLRRAEARIQEIQHMMGVAEEELRAAITTRDLSRVQTALHEARRLNVANQALQDDAEGRLAHLAQAKTAQNELLPTLSGVNLVLVQAMLDRAREFDADPEVLRAAENRISEIQQMMADAANVLARAVEGRDQQALQAAMSEAARLQAVSPEVTNQARARLAVIEEIDAATDQLRGLLATDDSSLLRHSLSRAREVGVDESVIALGEEARHRISRLKHDLRSRLVDLSDSGTDADELQRVVDECRRLHAASHRRLDTAEARIAMLQR